MIDSIIAEISKARPHDTWLTIKLSEINAEYQSLLEDHHRLIRDNSKLRTNINRLRAGMDEITTKPQRDKSCKKQNRFYWNYRFGFSASLCTNS